MRAEAITTAEQMAQVHAAMLADGGHNVPCVTHVLIGSDESIWGAFSVAYAPTLFFWANTRKSNALGSLRGMRMAVAEFRRLGHRRILLPIQVDSPFYPWARSIGLSPIGPCELFEFNPPE